MFYLTVVRVFDDRCCSVIAAFLVDALDGTEEFACNVLSCAHNLLQGFMLRGYSDVFFGISVLTDLSTLLTQGSDDQEEQRQLRKLISLRDWLMSVLAFPVGVLVVTMFWALYLYDRELVYPKILDSFIPQWINHGMHTTVLPFILIEMRTTYHNYPHRKAGQAAVSFFSTGYILWICWIHHVTGMWVYPLLDHLASFPRIAVFVASVGAINILYVVGEILNRYIWDKSRYVEEKLSSKNKID
ncbi:androgen-induced gene 1 protein [Narcine bancroftii]|uniref:androgen-induced gene 1 protein n=1 Tax=Narcine bancroftii TaxID=1343680 RepID=UPI0038321E02